MGVIGNQLREELRRPGKFPRAVAAALLSTAAGIGGMSGTACATPSAKAGTAAAATAPARGSLLFSTNFHPSSFNRDVVGSSSLTENFGPPPSLECRVKPNGAGSGPSKMIASVAKWSVIEPTAIWAVYDVTLNSIRGDLQSGFYFEGIGGVHRHLHIDFGADEITLRNPIYQDEGPLVSVPGLGTPGTRFHFVVVDTSPRYRVFVNGKKVIDYTDSFPASTPAALGFDCAADSTSSSGADAVIKLAVYTVNNP